LLYTNAATRENLPSRDGARRIAANIAKAAGAGAIIQSSAAKQLIGRFDRRELSRIA
jgi:hypothetical protein